ncbi:MAG: hypothetical protein LUE16_06015 [Lachnospiraceae bacterium]|nr:hypothetical protein [Lachnospiraceae bacterium]
MEFSKYVACICEGAAEEVIINILLDHDKLIFHRSQLVEEKPLRCRDAKKFEERYLRKGFSDKISVVRILDSRRENFRLSKAYKHKVDVINVITAPEIEMLVIFAENKYMDFKASRKKPSEFCEQDLGFGTVKSKTFTENYFRDVNVLISAIKEYRQISRIPAGECTLADLLK